MPSIVRKAATPASVSRMRMPALVDRPEKIRSPTRTMEVRLRRGASVLVTGDAFQLWCSKCGWRPVSRLWPLSLSKGRQAQGPGRSGSADRVVRGLHLGGEVARERRGTGAGCGGLLSLGAGDVRQPGLDQVGRGRVG